MTAFNFRANLSIELETTNNQTVLASASSLVAATTKYWALEVNGPNSATETDAQFKVQQTATVSGLWCNVLTNGITAASTMNFRKNTANGNQTISFPASTTGVFEDAVNSDTLAVNDLVNYQAIPGATGSNFAIFAMTMLYQGPAGVAAIPPIPQVIIFS